MTKIKIFSLSLLAFVVISCGGDTTETNTKTVVSEVESILVNKISNTPVRGYEIFKQDVTLTKNGYYRVWIGLRLPLGEYNKMYNFTIAEAVDAYNLKEKANIKYKELMKDNNDNSNIQ